MPTELMILTYLRKAIILEGGDLFFYIYMDIEV